MITSTALRSIRPKGARKTDRRSDLAVGAPAALLLRLGCYTLAARVTCLPSATYSDAGANQLVSTLSVVPASDVPFSTPGADSRAQYQPAATMMQKWKSTLDRTAYNTTFFLLRMRRTDAAPTSQIAPDDAEFWQFLPDDSE